MAEPSDRYSVATAAALAYWRGLLGRGFFTDVSMAITMMALLVLFCALFFPWFLPRSVWIALRARA